MLGTLSMCEHQGFLQYNIGLKGKSNKSSVKGTCVHRVLQALGDKRLAIKNGKKTVDFEGKRLKLDQCDDLELLTNMSFDYYTSFEKDLAFTKADLKDCINWANIAVSYNQGMLDPRNQDIYATEKFFDIELPHEWAKYEYKIGDKTIIGSLGLKGTIDLILHENDNTLQVLDYKTGRRINWANFKEKTYEDLEYDPQLLLYYYALKNSYPDKDFLVSIYYINSGGLFTFVYDEEHYRRAENMIKQRFEYIKNIQLPRLVSPDHDHATCKYMCGFNKIKEGTDQSICHFFHNEIKTKGMEKVIEEHANFDALKKYTGGGRIEE